MAVQPTRRLFTVSEYHRMVQAGILSEGDRLELIEGELLYMPPISKRHSACVARLSQLFFRQLGDDALIWVQNPIELTEFTEPQPDCVLLQNQTDYYASGLPTPDKVLLLVEVSDTSADIDRRVKVPLFARNDIVEVWLVDLEQETLTVYSDPSLDGYRTVRVLRRGENVSPSAFPARTFRVDDILV